MRELVHIPLLQILSLVAFSGTEKLPKGWSAPSSPKGRVSFVVTDSRCGVFGWWRAGTCGERGEHYTAWLVLLRCWLSSKLCDYKQLHVSRALLSRERLPGRLWIMAICSVSVYVKWWGGLHGWWKPFPAGLAKNIIHPTSRYPECFAPKQKPFLFSVLAFIKLLMCILVARNQT